MASGVTYGANKRITFLPERTDNDNGHIIAGQEYDDIWFLGGTIQNVDLINCTLTPSGGGGGVTSERIVSSGTSTTATLNQIVLFNSAATSAKTVNIPTATGTLNIIIIQDYFGNAGTYNITAVPASGTIAGGQGVVYTDNSTITLLDTSLSWIQI